MLREGGVSGLGVDARNAGWAGSNQRSEEKLISATKKQPFGLFPRARYLPEQREGEEGKEGDDEEE